MFGVISSSITNESSCQRWTAYIIKEIGLKCTAVVSRYSWLIDREDEERGKKREGAKEGGREGGRERGRG